MRVELIECPDYEHSSTTYSLALFSWGILKSFFPLPFCFFNRFAFFKVRRLCSFSYPRGHFWLCHPIYHLPYSLCTADCASHFKPYSSSLSFPKNFNKSWPYSG